MRLYRLERACQVQLDAAAVGTLNRIPDDVAERSGRDMDVFSALEADRAGDLEFDALRRRLDKIDPSYRD